MKKSTTECRKDCDVYADWCKATEQNVDLIMENGKMEDAIECAIANIENDDFMACNLDVATLQILKDSLKGKRL